MKILLAGSAGFIGSNLALRLLEEGHRVIGLDNFITGQRRNTEELSRNRSFEFREGDVTLGFTVEGPLDWVLHFASPASPPKFLKYPLQTLMANSLGTRLLLDLAREKSASFFLASTSEVYGDPVHHPQRESDWGNVNSVGPRSVYDEGKRFAEALVTAFGKECGIPTRIVRIFNTYGPRMGAEDGRLITNFATQALANRPISVYGDGQQTRSLQYIDDLLDGVLALMRVDYASPVNLGNPHEITVLEVARKVIEMTGSSSTLTFHPLPVDDPRKRKPDIGLARKLLNWEPKVTLENGLIKTIAHLRAQGAPSL